MSLSNYDVVIVGGGLVGLSLACALDGSRLSVLVLEAKQAAARQEQAAKKRRGFALESGFDARTSAVNPASKDLLERCGVWEKCNTDRFAPYEKMLVWDARGASRIEFSADMIGESCLGYIAENHEILAALMERVQELDNVEVRFGVSVRIFESMEAGQRITLDDGTEIACQLLVGADGGNSRIRELAGLRTFRWHYDQQALVTTVETELAHDFTARQSFTRDGPLALLPLAHDKLCSVVWSTREIEQLQAMSDEALCRELTKATEQVLGNVLGADRRQSFPLYQQHAMRYTRSHLALIGDAAHTIHPLAGQGANLGFADANALAIELGQCRFTGSHPGDKDLLVRYERRRKPENLLMASVMEGFKRLYDVDDPRFGWLRNTGMRWVNDQEGLKRQLVRFASGH